MNVKIRNQGKPQERTKTKEEKRKSVISSFFTFSTLHFPFSLFIKCPPQEGELRRALPSFSLGVPELLTQPLCAAQQLTR
jgi:hypothetical protein